MREEFLHYIWKNKLFLSCNLKTQHNERIDVLKSGILNTNSGPDFLNAQIKVDDQLWVGNVEIHVNSSDWYLHHHENDKNYDAVILHVVWEHDADVFMKNNKPLPILVLKGLIEEKLLLNYKKKLSKKINWISCDSQINTVDSFVVDSWVERLYFERLERKSDTINELLRELNNDFEAVLFVLISQNFGMKINAVPFFQLAKSIDFTIIRKERSNEFSFSALIYGQAGFLNDDFQEEYYDSLQKEYNYLQHKYHLKPIENNQFLFFRMRPTNFPTIRLAQLISLFHLQENLFSKIVKVSKLEDFYALFSVDINDFWKTHYTFNSVSKKSAKKLTKSFIDLLIINTIIPLKFLYKKSKGVVDAENLIDLAKQIKPEKNNIISKFVALKISAESAFKTQALLELKNNYCAPKRCLECAIGIKILSK